MDERNIIANKGNNLGIGKTGNCATKKMVRAAGIEPAPQAWEAHVLPIYYARKYHF